MKYQLKLIAIILFAGMMQSCNSDDDNTTTPPSTQNGITIGGNFTAADNAYIIFDRTAPYDDAFWVVLADGTLINDTSDQVFASTNTSTAAALLVDNSGQVATQNAVNVTINTYALENDDTVVVESITNFTDTFTQNGQQYGEIDADTATNYLIENTGSGTVDITSITKDFSTRTGTIDFTFSISDDNGVVITASYSGNFTMLNGDT